jgi:hypothetical protein
MFNFDERASGWFADMIRVAVISAREQTDLRPMCLFDGKGTPGIISWLKANGVPVVRTQVPFRDELFSEEVLAANADTGYHPQHAAGAFLRLVAADFVDDDYFLYTDCDVMFLGNPETAFFPPRIVAACPEIYVGNKVVDTSDVFNSGVLFINKTAFSAERDRMVELLRANRFYFRENRSYDQAMMNRVLDGRWERLPGELNWRPFQGANPNASIVHFHGPKPHRIGRLLDGQATATDVPEAARFAEQYAEEYRHHVALYRAYLAKA